MSFKTDHIRKILIALGNLIRPFSPHPTFFFSILIQNVRNKGGNSHETIQTAKLLPWINQFAIKSTSSLQLTYYVRISILINFCGFIVTFLINHLVLKLVEKRRMLHILFVRKNGEVDSVTLFKVTIFIRLGIFH